MAGLVTCIPVPFWLRGVLVDRRADHDGVLLADDVLPHQFNHQGQHPGVQDAVVELPAGQQNVDRLCPPPFTSLHPQAAETLSMLVDGVTPRLHLPGGENLGQDHVALPLELSIRG